MRETHRAQHPAPGQGQYEYAEAESHQALIDAHVTIEDVTEFMDMFYEVPYAFYTEAVIQPENDYIEDWELFIGLAKRLNFPIELPCGTINPGTTPTKFDLIKMMKSNPSTTLSKFRSS